MRVALGTVQFGMDYGVANTSGQVMAEQATAILQAARHAGLDTLDTAIAYGNSESKLGELGVHGWKIISKLPPLPDAVENVEKWVVQQLQNSLQRLGAQHLDALLLHRPSDILGQHGIAYARALLQAKNEGLIHGIGYSIYSPDELAPLCTVLPPDIVQAPYNIIDRRLATSGWMGRLADNGVRIHTRSVFLQGLLLMPAAARPPWFDRWQPLWQVWSDSCVQSGLSPLAVSLRYVLSQADIERVVVGVDSVTQLHEIVTAVNGPAVSIFPQIESQDIELIEPSRWKLQ